MKIWLAITPCILLIITATTVHEAAAHEAATHEGHSSAGTDADTLKVLVYSDTGYYRHPDIPKMNLLYRNWSRPALVEYSVCEAASSGGNSLGREAVSRGSDQ